VYIEPAKERIQSVIENWCGADDGKGVKVLTQVVGHTVGLQHSCEEICSRTKAVIIDVLDGEKTEDARGLESAADVLDELVVPSGVVHAVQTSSCNVGWLGEVPKAVATKLLDATSSKTDAEDAEDVGQIASSRRVENEALVEEPQEQGERQVQNERDQKRQPPLYRVSCRSNCQNEWRHLHQRTSLRTTWQRP